MKRAILPLLAILLPTGLFSPNSPATQPASESNVVRLRATADIWLADTTRQERNGNAGRDPEFKLKSIQEMAAIRFNAKPVSGKEVLSARLFLHKASRSMLRYIRVSTVGQDWEEGVSRSFGAANGATYLWADATRKRAWSYPGSEFADVVMGMGQTITTYGEIKQERNNWISVSVTPELIYALAAENTDGLAVMDGGNPGYFNNLIHSVQSGIYAPYLEVVVGKPLAAIPATPQVVVEPAPDRAHLTTGAIKISIEPDSDVFCWKLQIDGTPVPRWRVPYPRDVQETGREQEQIRSGRTKRGGRTVFYLDTLEPQKAYTLTVVAVSRGGTHSPMAELGVQSSPVLPGTVELEKLIEPSGTAGLAKAGSRFSVWPVPGLIKIDPLQGLAMFGDMAGNGRSAAPNAVWNGQAIQIFGARGEYLSYQLVIERVDPRQPLRDIKIRLSDLKAPASVIGRGELELFKNWYARNQKGRWQPAYCIPWEQGKSFEIPDRERGIASQQNQSVYVDVYVPKHARAGIYTGTVTVESSGDKATLPIELQVYDFALSDELTFRAELNSYNVPRNHLDYHRLAHQHRLVFNPWVVRPQLHGSGREIQVQWDEYDKAVGPLLSGKAFEDNRRAHVPTPAMYLPFEDSWPTPLSRHTYNYRGHWPGRGESARHLIDHYMTAPYIGDGLSQGYKDALLTVQKQFVEHFKQQGWNKTEMQLFYGGKNTHRLEYGTNMWWTTDEPYHWDDWLALQFFGNLFAQGRHSAGADARVWAIRADLSRPMWTGRVLDGIADTVYWGGFARATWGMRAAWLAENTGLTNMTYGSANQDTQSNTQTVTAMLYAWSHGADGFMPWQTLGDDASLDKNDNGPGTALLVPGTRFGHPVIGDMRLKAMRDGQQAIEYLALLTARHHLKREQVDALLVKALSISTSTGVGTGPDDAGAARFSAIKDWQLSALRRRLAELITSKQP